MRNCVSIVSLLGNQLEAKAMKKLYCNIKYLKKNQARVTKMPNLYTNKAMRSYSKHYIINWQISLSQLFPSSKCLKLVHYRHIDRIPRADDSDSFHQHIFKPTEANSTPEAKRKTTLASLSDAESGDGAM